MKNILQLTKKLSLIQQIMIGMAVGILLGLVFPQAAFIATFGNLFVGALKAIAPLLVFFIVIAALAQQKEGHSSNMKTIVGLYLFGTFIAAFIGVIATFLLPVKIVLHQATTDIAAPEGIGAVMQTLLLKLVDNPVNALATANYIGILAWAVVFGIALRQANDTTKTLLHTISEATSQAVRWIISLAPLGIMGLVYATVATNGLEGFADYGVLLVALLGSMAFVAFIANPLIVYILLRRNPYPLVWRCIKESGITAFFTRSSAANIPVNMELCRKLGLDEDTYSVSIPLGATINMSGAAITITVLTLAAVQTLGIQVDFLTALVLSLVATVSACGASGVTGGSLLLIPVACSLFGISNDIAMQVVGVGFIIGVIQDSCETALNSSMDVLFTAVAEYVDRKKRGAHFDM